MELRAALLEWGWRLDACLNGTYRAWNGPLAPTIHQVHARHPDFGAHLLDLLFTDMDAHTWRYRRDPSITRPLDLARRVTPDGLPHLAPELVLLFKAGTADRPPRGKDEADFRRVLPRLDPQAWAWLAGVLEGAHLWQSALGAT